MYGADFGHAQSPVYQSHIRFTQLSVFPLYFPKTRDKFLTTCRTCENVDLLHLFAYRVRP